MTGLFPARALRAHGISPRRISRLVASGVLTRVRRGWYATAGAAPDVVSAVATGGRVTCVSALASAGAWVMPHTELHVRVARGVAVRPGPSQRIHWTDEGMGDEPVDDAATSLGIAARCLDLRAAVVVADSVLNRRLLDARDVERILLATPRGRRILGLLDGRAESGLETLARLALRRRNLRVRPQFVVQGVGRVDLLVGDRLVLELDGREWHTDFERDRARDRALTARGYLVMRASYRQVLSEWPTVDQQIAAIVARREHRWRRSPTHQRGRRPYAGA